jgi:hypothetical protein
MHPRIDPLQLKADPCISNVGQFLFNYNIQYLKYQPGVSIQ